MKIDNKFKTEPKYIISCVECGEKLKTYCASTKVCSKECSKNRQQRLSGRHVMTKKEDCVPSGTVGAISELLICSDLMKKGYAVFRSLSPACFCDAVAIKKDKVLRVEIRTGYQNTETKNFQFPTKIGGNGDNSPDCYGVYERNSGQIIYLDLNKRPIVV